MDRMDRAQFFTKLAPMDEEHLRKTLWNLYWRGTAAVRQRIEAELEPGRTPPRVEPERVDPDSVLDEVRDFVALARSGAYIAGDRRVSPKQRSGWRFTFRQLLADARTALLTDDGSAGAIALEALIDLACEVRDVDYFRSDDPMEAAKIVVSDEVALLWSRILERRGFPAFAEQAAGQLIRWESRYGWTRSGFGQMAEKETSLATVLADLLPVPDAWTTFTDAYLAELDRLAAPGRATPTRPWQTHDYERNRTESLAEWHSQVVERLVDGEAAYPPRPADHQSGPRRAGADVPAGATGASTRPARPRPRPDSREPHPTPRTPGLPRVRRRARCTTAMAGRTNRGGAGPLPPHHTTIGDRRAGASEQVVRPPRAAAGVVAGGWGMTWLES
jgi:hypothetical protein